MTEHSKTITGNTIKLASGAYFDFVRPEDSLFTIEDIAHALSHICRFTGHCHRFYSVAEHSVHASHLISATGHEFEALMHDATEAFIGDIAKPLKVMLPDYQRIEERAERVVLGRFGISLPLDPAIKLTDLKMLRIEQAQAMQCADNWPEVMNLDATGIELQFWTPTEAKSRFLERFHELASTKGAPHA